MYLESNNKSLLVLILLLVGSLLSFSCKKEAYKVDENFVGSWDGQTAPSIKSISISKVRGESTYYAFTGSNDDDDVAGTARVSTKKDILQIGNKKLPINEYPFIICDTSCAQLNLVVWSMRIDDTNYLKLIYN